MAEKIEKPIVSKELAEDFERFNKSHLKRYALDLGNYGGAEHYGLDSESNLAETIAKMLVLGYEIKKPNLKYIRLRSGHIDYPMNYLNLNTYSNSYFVDVCGTSEFVKCTFTQAEADEFLKDEPEGMWIVEEVEDQYD